MNGNILKMLVIEAIQGSPQLRIHGDNSGLSDFIRILDQSLTNDKSAKINVKLPPYHKLESSKTFVIKELIIYKSIGQDKLFNEASDLSFEWNPIESSVEIHGNSASLANLKQKCIRLNQPSMMDHVHLMVPEWGGDELVNRVYQDSHLPIYHVKLLKWN